MATAVTIATLGSKKAIASNNILIVSVRGDLHAAIIRHTLVHKLGISCSILEIDAIAYSSSLSIRILGSSTEFEFLDSDGLRHNVAEFSTIWWRRGNRSQFIEDKADLTAAEIDLINNDSAAAVRGGLLASFEGNWVNHPVATRTAEDKITQLRVASSSGFRLPKTLISQDADEVRRFITEVGGKAILKSLRGTNLASLFSAKINSYHIHAASINAAPCIYQEYIDGTEHLRIQVFGARLYCVKLSSREMDWRENLNIPAEMYMIDSSTREKVFTTMNALKLKMGIIDLKLTPSGDVVWLEINPQGQFLFLEPMTNFDFKLAFAEFLLEASTA